MYVYIYIYIWNIRAVVCCIMSQFALCWRLRLERCTLLKSGVADSIHEQKRSCMNNYDYHLERVLVSTSWKNHAAASFPGTQANLGILSFWREFRWNPGNDMAFQRKWNFGTKKGSLLQGACREMSISRKKKMTSWLYIRWMQMTESRCSCTPAQQRSLSMRSRITGQQYKWYM